MIDNRSKQAKIKIQCNLSYIGGAIPIKNRNILLMISEYPANLQRSLYPIRQKMHFFFSQYSFFSWINACVSPALSILIPE